MHTDYFSFKFQENNKWLFETLSHYADTEWKQVYEEFHLLFNNMPVTDVFIKNSHKHLLGSTRGSFIIINAETINAKFDDKEKTLKRTFRHELAHVLINQLSNHQFNRRTDILGGFLHEGLASLVENNWNDDNETLINEAALNYHIYDKSLLELLPSLGHFSEYDYTINYSLGYVFWGEFLKLYGRQSVGDFLSQLGTYEEDDRQFEGIWFLFHKSNQVEVDLYKVFHATERTLEKAFDELDPDYKMDTRMLKGFRVSRENEHQLLIPYSFENPESVYCLFRKKDSLTVDSQKLKAQDYSGRMGGQCQIPQGNPDEVQVFIHFEDGVDFYSRWVGVPDLTAMPAS